MQQPENRFFSDPTLPNGEPNLGPKLTTTSRRQKRDENGSSSERAYPNRLDERKRYFSRPDNITLGAAEL